MEAEAFFPQEYEGLLVPEEVFADAYAAVSDKERAGYKLAIARLAACLGEPSCRSEARTMQLRQGALWHQRIVPAPWALVVWNEGMESPSRLLAALMPAILAGVPYVFACRVTGAPSGALVQQTGTMSLSASILTALELAGQEVVADIPSSRLIPLVRSLAGHGRGRIITLGTTVWCADLLQEAASLDIPLWSALYATTIGVAPFPEDAIGPDYDMLALFQPDAQVLPVQSIVDERAISAVYCPPDQVDDWVARVPFAFTPGNESCWVCPGLQPAFFLELQQGFSG